MQHLALLLRSLPLAGLAPRFGRPQAPRAETPLLMGEPPVLRGALSLTSGRPLTFQVSQAGGPPRLQSLRVVHDPQGQAWLESGPGARLAFEQGLRQLTLGPRVGPQDDLLDAFALALGLTPYPGGPASWWHAPGPRRLPGPRWERWLPQGRVWSSYHRLWCPDQHLWAQYGGHRGRWATVMTRADLCPRRGVVRFELHREGTRLLSAEAQD